MAKDLPYFKFFCSEWNDGDITLEDFKIQGLFINICSYYWSNECSINFDKLIKRFKTNEEDLNYLLGEKLIKIDSDREVFISFLDEQQAERERTSKQASEAGKASAEKRRLAKLKEESNSNPTPVEKPLNRNPTIKRREEERREEKKREIPAYIDFLKYAVSKKPKVNPDDLELKYNSWVENDWKDGNDKPINNWKTKILNTLPYISENTARTNPNPTVNREDFFT